VLDRDRMVDWQGLFEPHHVIENVIRASSIFLMLFLLLRFLPNRKTGSLGPTDLLVVVLLATAVHTALIREGTSITDAAVMVGTIIGWSVFLDIIGARVPWLKWVLHSDPVQVIRDGAVVQRNLRREFMTEDELKAQLRLQGIDKVGDVKNAFIEHDGRVSVIPRDKPRRALRRGRSAITGQ
jgi:uncharacterized membrane protein YcaP (DUF421 family)